MSLKKISLKPNEFLCRKDEKDNDLYYVESGELLVFGVEGTKVTPIAYINGGEFVGELSFFDNTNRSAYVMCTGESELILIPAQDKNEYMPDWLIKIAQNMCHQIRSLDQRIIKKGIRRNLQDSVKPLSIEEQRKILEAIEEDREKRIEQE
ncbi:MAG: cyclic nucleotide-binding domain-containing protein [Bdellovibrionota bacterium]|nr:cyclic nucleotide-binding domain-containing protein [Bdellovibrionota bacterium]